MNNIQFNIGVLFCGGCNPTFDRQEFYAKLSATLYPLCGLSLFKCNYIYDAILIINGCTSMCLTEKFYNAKIIFLFDDNLQFAIGKIKSVLLESN